MTQWQNWIGKTMERREVIAPFPANALAATLDRDDPEYVAATPLPPLWHWLHFLPIFKLSDAGYDGHEALGSFLPPLPLPRRMWAGSRLQFLGPMRIGRDLRKRSTIRNVTEKAGRSGPLAFVTVGHEVFDAGTKLLDEEHDIVYRAPIAPDAPQPDPTPAPLDYDFARQVTPDPVLLFRYSALTFNGHRIHYDHPFCTQTEGYTGLVVHGPLLATLLLDLLRREMPKAQVSHFTFRAKATVLDTEAFDVQGRMQSPQSVALWVRRHDGALAMEATATLAD